MRSTRDTILNVSMRLFARKGYAGCSIREICQAARVTKPVLYYHFRSKEHLYQELMLDMFNQTRKNLLRLSKFRGSLRDRLILYVSTEFRNSKRDPDSIRLLFRMMFAPEGEYPHFNFLEESKQVRKIVAGFIKEQDPDGIHRNPELTATALMGMMLVQVLEFLFTGRQTLTRRNAAKLVDLLLPFPASGDNPIPYGIGRGGCS